MEQTPAAVIQAIATRLGLDGNTKADRITQINGLNIPKIALDGLIASETKLLELQKTRPPPIKLPKFDDSNPRAWIKQCRIIAPVFNIMLIIARLPTSLIAQLDEEELSACTNYDEFSSLILPKAEGSHEAALVRLLESQELGDHQPSTFLLNLQNLAQQAMQPVDSALVKQKFISAMPPAIRAPLAALKSPPIKEIAEAADRMMAATKSIATTPANTLAAVSVVDDLAQQVAAILGRSGSRQNVEPHLRFQRYNNQHKTFNKRDSSNHSTRGRSNSTSGGSICYYHMRFGKQANKCAAPCDFNRLQNVLSGAGTPSRQTAEQKNA